MLPIDKHKINIKHDIKAFFQSEKWKEALIFLFFFILSSFFWLLQTLQQPSEINIKVPLNYIHLPNSLAVSDTFPNYLTLKVQDKGTNLLIFMSDKKEKSITFDMQSMNPSQHSYVITQQQIEEECKKILPPSFKLLSFHPTNILINYSHLKKKKLPVSLDGSIIPASGFMLTENLKFTPSEINVYASPKILDSLETIYTQKVELSGLKESRHLKLKLAPPPHVKVSEIFVDLTVKIEEYTEKVFEVPVTSKDFPKNYRLRTFPAYVQISCLLPLSRYTSVNSGDFEASVHYKDVVKDSVSTAPLTISRKPEWINSYRFNPERVEFLIEQVK